MPNDNSNTQQSGDGISAVHEVMEALVDAEHYVCITVAKVDGNHVFQLHYSSPLVISSLVQYGQSCADAWLGTTDGADTAEGDED